ncbi:DUF2064 domain-containing protein [uncultured Amnibacterium sp.]|uniref:TIGR04282 family arsenosugar biosynthesis glycosyltransferase n=1 Tax=uncultured Amnibacterium sp. TaxID=1631851 RepID=UPI0035CA4E11
MSTLVVIAKECLPGAVKTRLTPPLSPAGAARVAAASLEATLRTARAVRADRHVLFLQGAPPAAAADFDVLQQPAGTLDVRLAALFDAMTDRTLLIGMDTPQLERDVLQSVLDDDSGADAWFGPATDGGFWALGMDRPRGDLIRGVGMSLAATGAEQRARLTTAGLRVRDLPVVTDVDTIDSARQVAALLPGSAFTAALHAELLRPELLRTGLLRPELLDAELPRVERLQPVAS